MGGSNELLDTSPLKGTAVASKGSRKLCLCSKLEVVHYAHAPGEALVPVNSSTTTADPDNSMDMEDDVEDDG